MNTDLLMAGAMLAASVFIYATGRWLLPKGVRLRIQPVRRSAAREAALSVSHCSDESRSLDGDRQRVNGRLLGDTDVRLDNRVVGSEPAGSLTNLVPFSRAERGYALNFSQKKVH